MIENRYVLWYNPSQKADSAIIVLPGRFQSGFDIAKAWSNTFLSNTLIVLAIPKEREWYPMPISPLNQEEAVGGLEIAREKINEVILNISENFNISKNKIALIGFSAGGVMANYVAMHSNFELAGSVCHAGAIFEPESVPVCKYPDMPFVLTHSFNDDTFDWFERYLPMKKSLIENGYLVRNFEENNGHQVSFIEIEQAALSICTRLGYSLEDSLNRSSYFYNDDFALFSDKARL